MMSSNVIDYLGKPSVLISVTKRLEGREDELKKAILEKMPSVRFITSGESSLIVVVEKGSLDSARLKIVNVVGDLIKS